MRNFKLSMLAATAALLVLSGCTKGGAAQPTDGVGTEADWSAVGGGADEASYSRLGQVNTNNAGDLGLAWSLDLPGEVTLEATPLAVNGVIYFSGSYATVYAVDGATGKQLWKYDPETWKHNPQRM